MVFDFSSKMFSSLPCLGIDKNGHPSIASSGCSDSIGDVHVDFHGGIAFILNLFRGTVERDLKGMLQPKVRWPYICDVHDHSAPK